MGGRPPPGMREPPLTRPLHLNHSMSHHQFDPPAARSSNLNQAKLTKKATAALRAATGFPTAGGRRLPQPPPEGQRAMSMPMPNTPLPINQRPDRLSTRNRKLPQIPGQMPGVNGSASGLTGSLFGFAKKLTGTTPQHGHPPPMGPNGLMAGRAGYNTNSLPGSAKAGRRGRPGRGAVLPSVPSVPGRRTLPDRAGAHSRSLEHDHRAMGPTTKLETVLEAGRGVRKLPVPMPKTGTGAARANGGPFEHMLFNRSLDESMAMPPMPMGNPENVMMHSEWT